jgi:hypothetical protein
LTTKSENLIPEPLSQITEFESSETAVNPAGKKAFVEPEVSFPIDVLEATTFFQLTDSGATN